MIGLTLLLVGGSAVAINDTTVQRLVRKGLDYAYVEEFDSAGARFDSVIVRDPGNPAGYFFKAGLLQLRMMDECHFQYEQEYLALLRATVAASQKVLEERDDPWAEFYLGSAYAHRAVFEGLKHNYWETFNYGVKGGRILQNLIGRDSLFYDAYLGSGTFEYFWARATRYLPILKLVDGDAPEAIRKLHVAAARSYYSGPTAENSLVFVYGEEAAYDKALALADDLLRRYPRSKTFTWSKAQLAFKMKDHAVALELFQRLYTRYEETQNYANMAQCQLLIGKCLIELDDKPAARRALKQTISYKPHADAYPQIKEYCREAYTLLSRLL